MGIKYINTADYCYMDQEFSYRYMESIINIDWVNYLESVNNEIAGEVILRFPRWTDKMEGNCTQARIMQRLYGRHQQDRVRRYHGGDGISSGGIGTDWGVL